MIDENTEHVLYRFDDDRGRLLYVGITLHVAQRVAAHRASKPWWDKVAAIRLQRFSTRVELEAAERAAIKTEHPVHNVTHQRARRVSAAPLPVTGWGPNLTPMTDDQVVAYALSARTAGEQRQRDLLAEIGRAVTELHDDYGWTWARVAREFEVDPSTVYRWAKAS